MTHWGRFALALALSGCCFDALSPPATSTPIPPPSMPGTGTGPLLPGGAASGVGTPISFGPGSTDPTFAQGYAGGPIAGPTLDPSCYVGNYSTAPSHILTLTGALPYLRIMAFSASGDDLTMAVRGPNGVVTCVDDFDGLNPAVELTAPMAGDYQVFVGNYRGPAPEAYELGVSTSSSVLPSSMHSAPTSVVGTLAPAAGPVSMLLLTGTATVTSLSGSPPGVAVGSACTYTQTRVLSVGGTGVLDCRWQITCAATDLYGGTVPGGYQPCSDPSWSPGTLAMDSATSATDTDPTFLFSGSTITVGDDASGTHGAFTATLTTSSPTPVPPMPMPQVSS